MLDKLLADDELDELSLLGLLTELLLWLLSLDGLLADELD